MRVLKWWRADDVDDVWIISNYVVFEFLAAALEYRRRRNKKWTYARGAAP